jgi:hypothetical protein
MIQYCPVEVLDKIFEYSAYSDPENAKVTLCSLMVTCSYFRTIAKRHFVRIVCLRNAEKVNAFASYLERVIESGDYGKVVLPIQHFAVAGKYRIPRGLSNERRSDAEVEAERVLLFIITAAAPSLLTLAVFGVDGHKEDRHIKGLVPITVKFPQLRDLVALEQQLIPLDFHGRDNTANISRFPNLCRLYVLSDHSLGGFPLSLPTLRHLRLEMLDTAIACLPPFEKNANIHSLIIDAPQYDDMLIYGCIAHHQSPAEYEMIIDTYRILIEKLCGTNDSGVVIPVPENTSYTSGRRVVAAWANAVAGGAGCWTTTWTPTVLNTEKYKYY